MATDRIPFLPQQESGSDALGGASPIARNIVFDGKGSVRRRPTLGPHHALLEGVVDPGGIAGLHVTSALDIFAVAAPSPLANIYRLNSTTAQNLSPSSLQSVAGGRRPTFAETEALLVIAAGAEIQKIVLADMVSSRLGGSPPRATHVIAHRSRLLCNTIDDNLNTVTYSGLAAGLSYAGHEDWLSSASGTVNADARPGPVVALWENVDEVLAFGDTNHEALAADPTLIYVPVLSREHGCIAPYSVARAGSGFAWLDHNRQFVLSDGRSSKAVSLPAIQKQLALMADPSDCFGYRVQLGELDAFVWSLPSDGRTFVYSGGGWSQWSGLDGPFKMTALAQYLGDTIVGTSDGRVGKLDPDGYADFGETVTAYVETGFVTHGTGLKKHCQAIRVLMERGHGIGGELLLSYRDNKADPWSSPLAVNLGDRSDAEVVVQFRSLGTYRARQWRAIFSGTESFLLVGVEEEYAILKD